MSGSYTALQIAPVPRRMAAFVFLSGVKSTLTEKGGNRPVPRLRSWSHYSYLTMRQDGLQLQMFNMGSRPKLGSKVLSMTYL